MDRPAYVTKEGLEKMQTELHYLKTVKKREIAGRIEQAKELGDLSENAEYADAKDEMSFVEGHIRELDDMITRAVVIERSEGSLIQVGSTVALKNGATEKIYTIVGPTEADPLAGRISNETPLAQALLGKAVGEAVEVTVPSGKIQYTINKIS